MSPKFTALILLASLAGTLQAGEPRADKAAAAGADTIRALKRGGYVLYMRHAVSDTSIPDRVPEVDFEDCATQRPLSEAGRRQAARVGEAVRSLGIPIGEVRVSPYCRARETAELAFGKDYAVDASLATTSNLTDVQKAPRLRELRRWLGLPVPPGTNRVLISHNAPLMDAIGVFPRPEGVILVFRPDGADGFERIATIAPEDWPRLLALPR